MRFSVIIPALDEELFIGACLDSLRRQDYDGSYEVIVVDNGSRDRTSEIAGQHGARVFQEPTPGATHALIKGCAEASGEILVFTDADTEVPSDWLSRLDRHFAGDPGLAAVGGPWVFTDSGFLGNFVSRRIALPFYCRFFFPAARSLSSVNMAVRRDAYQRSGGFAPQHGWGYDSELCKRLVKCGDVVFDRSLFVSTSFRRFGGTCCIPLVQSFHLVKELVRHTYRYVCLIRHNRVYPTDAPIRVQPPSRAQRLLLNVATILALIAVLGFADFVGPSTVLFGAAVFHGPTRDPTKRVALTFDDGPHGKSTSEVLDILKAKGVKATFFVIGLNAQRYPDLVRREITEGHIVGNHTYDHSKVLALMPARRVDHDVDHCEQVVESIAGVQPKFFRPPMGVRSLTMIKAIRDLGYTTVLWDDGTNDYDYRLPSDVLARRIIARLRPGAIILLHDGMELQTNYSRDNMITALPGIIDSIRAAGYEIVRLDELLNRPSYFEVNQAPTPGVDHPACDDEDFGSESGIPESRETTAARTAQIPR
jgi:peptidoglycan/xylan/chitin deacetylase (PgdA/CDA1 family)